MANRISFKSIDVGPGRWLMHVRVQNDGVGREFKNWMQENYPDCMCVHRWNNGDDPYWEVRGGDMSIPMFIKLSWS